MIMALDQILLLTYLLTYLNKVARFYGPRCSFRTDCCTGARNKSDVFVLCVQCRYDVTSTSPVTFLWVFQKRSESAADDQQSTSSLRDDVARIYSVEVTNPRRGGAEKCKLCPQGASQDGYDSRSPYTQLRSY